MRIDSKSKIVGISALKIRDFLRKVQTSSWQVNYLKKSLNISLSKANQLISKLFEMGYIQIDDRSRDGEHWCVTDDGNRFALATAAMPIRRSTAERLIKQLMDKVVQVNEDDSYLYNVTKIGVFGSYLTTQDAINDVDIAAVLEPKEKNFEKHQLMIFEKVSEAKANGRYFSNFTDELFWPQLEILRFLKSRSKALSLQLINDQEFAAIDLKVLYDISDY